MLQAKVNEKHQYEIENADEGLKINGQHYPIDAIELNSGMIHLLVNGQSYTAELLNAAEGGKEMTIRINNEKHTVVLKDKNDLLLERLGMADIAGKKADDVKAPMPGMILRLMVNSGSEVKKGDGLLVLEAMKMENVIKAPHDGTIKEVKVSAGDKVDKNQVLVIFDHG